MFSLLCQGYLLETRHFLLKLKERYSSHVPGCAPCLYVSVSICPQLGALLASACHFCAGPLCVDYGFPPGQHSAPCSPPDFLVTLAWSSLSFLPSPMHPQESLWQLPHGTWTDLLCFWLFSAPPAPGPPLLNFTFLYFLPCLQRNVLHRCQNPTLIPLSSWLLGKHLLHCSWWRNAKLQLL